MKIPSIKKIAGTFGHKELERLNGQTLHAVLATVRDGTPYASLISYAYDAGERAILFLTPRKTTKYANIRKNSNVSLLIDTRKNSPTDYISASAYTIVGRARSLRAGRKRDALIKVFLRKHPDLKAFSKDRDVSLVSVSIDFCMKVGRFQEVYFLENGQNR